MSYRKQGFFAVLWIKLISLHIVGQWSTTKLHPSPWTMLKMFKLVDKMHAAAVQQSFSLSKTEANRNTLFEGLPHNKHSVDSFA